MMEFRHERVLTWPEWRAAVDWLMEHWREIDVLDRQGSPCERHVLKLSTMGLSRGASPENRSYAVRGPDDLVVEYMMRWG